MSDQIRNFQKMSYGQLLEFYGGTQHGSQYAAEIEAEISIRAAIAQAEAAAATRDSALWMKWSFIGLFIVGLLQAIGTGIQAYRAMVPAQVESAPAPR